MSTATTTAAPGAAVDAAERLRIAVITSSVREGRFCPTVAAWTAERAAERGDLEVDLVDLAEHPLPLSMPGPGGALLPDPAWAHAALGERLAAADGFVVVTPEYNHSFPAGLKNAIDWYRTEWQAKPVAFVSYGGLAGGLRAVEQLRVVFAELHATTIRETVSFHNVWEQFDAAGRLASPEAATAAATTLLDRLAWWSRALRQARATTPYGS
nr:NAD(P)H-dependent oxidoreductase [Streptomyces hoynatensis]